MLLSLTGERSVYRLEMESEGVMVLAFFIMILTQHLKGQSVYIHDQYMIVIWSPCLSRRVSKLCSVSLSSEITHCPWFKSEVVSVGKIIWVILNILCNSQVLITFCQTWSVWVLQAPAPSTSYMFHYTGIEAQLLVQPDHNSLKRVPTLHFPWRAEGR